MDFLVPFSSPKLWVYGYLGASFGFDTADFQSFDVASVSGYVGLMWNVKSASDYEGPFYCSSLTTSSLNVTRWGFPVTPNLQMCSSLTNEGTSGAYGFTVAVAGRSNSARIASSYTRYFPATEISGADIPGVAPSYRSVSGLWQSLLGGH